MILGIKTTTIFLILKIAVAFFILIAALMLFFELFGFPTMYRKKNVLFLTKKATTKTDTLDVLITKFAKFIERFVKFGEFKRKRLVSQFEILEIKMTPEEYYSQIIAKTLLFAAFSPICFIIHPIIGVFFLIVAVLIFLLQYNEIDSVMQKRKESIESELPKFVSVIEQTFKNDHDVIKLISTYVENGDTPLTKELEIALADMKTGDFETALNRLSSRVNSVFLSETVRGLQSALHGDDTVGYFNTLSVKLWDHEKIRIKKNALKTPSKVKYLVKVLLMCMFLIYICVFGTVIYEGLSGIFEMM